MSETAHPDWGLDDLEPRRAARPPRRRRPPRTRRARDKLLIAPPVGRACTPPPPTPACPPGAAKRCSADESLRRGGLPQVAAYAPEPARHRAGGLPGHRQAADHRRPRAAPPPPGDLEARRRAGGPPGAEGPPRRRPHAHACRCEAAEWVDQQIAPPAARVRCERPSTPSSPTPSPGTTPPGTPHAKPGAKKQTWDVALHTPTASEYAATSELHITGDTLVPRPTSTAPEPPTPWPPGKPATTSPSASARSTPSQPCSPVQRAATLTATAKRPVETAPDRQTVLYLHLDKTDLDDDNLVSRPRRAPRAGRHRRRSASGSAQLDVRIQPGDPVDGDDAVNGHDPPEPDPRPGHPARPHLPLPRLPGRPADDATSTTSSPTTPAAHPAKPDPPTSSRSAGDTTTPRPPVCGATSARPLATASGRGRTPPAPQLIGRLSGRVKS